MNSKGFSLLELLITLSVLSILIVCSFSSLGQIKQKNEREFLINEIKSAMSYAKIQAQASGRVLSLLPNAQQSDWSKGMDLLAYDEQDELVHRWSWNLTCWKVEWQGLNGTQRINLSGNTQAMSNGKFVLTNLRTQEKLVLYVNRLGRVRQA